MWIRFARKFIDEQPVLLKLDWVVCIQKGQLDKLLSVGGVTLKSSNAAVYLQRDSERMVTVRPPGDRGGKHPGQFAATYTVEISVLSPADAHIDGGRKIRIKCNSALHLTVRRSEFGVEPLLTLDATHVIDRTT
jgi:hypothetical protein